MIGHGSGTLSGQASSETPSGTAVAPCRDVEADALEDRSHRVEGFDLDGTEEDPVRGSGHIGQHDIERRMHLVGDVRAAPDPHGRAVDLRWDEIGALGQDRS